MSRIRYFICMDYVGINARTLILRSVPRMSIFRNKLLKAFALMLLTTLTIMYIYTRITILNRNLKSHNDSLYTNGENHSSKLKDTRQAVASNILNTLRNLWSAGAVNGTVEDSRTLLENTHLTNSLIWNKSLNSINVTRANLNTSYLHSKNTSNGDWLNTSKQREHTSSENVLMRRDKIRIVIYSFYHKLLKAAAKALDMTKCYHSSNCEVIFQEKWSTNPVHADAVVFQGNHMPTDKPPRLHTDQLFVYLNVESPQYLQKVRLEDPFFKEFFNWTMTYRRDSNIPYLYGSVLPRNVNKRAYLYKVEKTSEFLNYANVHENNDRVNKNTNISRKDYTAIFRRKTKSSVWFVSHCRTASRRERYVSQMMESTDIDIYGSCSNNTNRANICPKLNPDCGQNVKDTYKFIIAFENSLCEDYITEKVFMWFSENIIVVVRGARYYNRYLPKGTYIDADDFASPEDLAKFLNQLSKNEKEYIEYLKRMDNYIVISEDEHAQLAFCNLCYKLNNLDQFRKSAESLHQWWNVGKCTEPYLK